MTMLAALTLWWSFKSTNLFTIDVDKAFYFYLCQTPNMQDPFWVDTLMTNYAPSQSRCCWILLGVQSFDFICFDSPLMHDLLPSRHQFNHGLHWTYSTCYSIERDTSLHATCTLLRWESLRSTPVSSFFCKPRRIRLKDHHSSALILIIRTIQRGFLHVRVGPIYCGVSTVHMTSLGPNIHWMTQV